MTVLPSLLQQMNKVNILTDKMPDCITLFGTEYPVYTSFKNWVKIACILENEGGVSPSAVAEILKLCYRKTLPPNQVSAILGVYSFLNRDTDFSVSPGKKKEKICSFFQDGDVIYSAFYSKYGIDLEKSDMHWYKFCALFENLADDNPFRTLMKIRTCDVRQIKNPDARRRMNALKARYEIKGKTEIDVAQSIENLF